MVLWKVTEACRQNHTNPTNTQNFEHEWMWYSLLPLCLEGLQQHSCNIGVIFMHRYLKKK